MKYWLRLLSVAWVMVAAVAWPAAAQELRAYENVTASFEHLTVATRTRDVLYLRPTHPSGTQPAPLLVLLEYLQGTPAGMADLTEAATLVRDYGITVALPESANGRWNFGPTSFSQADDVGFLTAVIDDAVTRFSADRHRVYMGGYSNGGHMTQRYACEHPDKIAAGAIISGSIHTIDALNCHPAIGTPMIIFHGTEDKVITYNGNLLFRSSTATAQLWAGFLGCSTLPTGSDLPDVADDDTSVHLDRYTNCTGGSPGLPGVDQYTIIGGGHTWPGSFSFTSGLGATSQELSATRTLWQFVSQFSRP